MPVESATDCALGDFAGRFVGRIGASVAAKHVAWKLVERDDEGERAFRRLFPRRQRARAGGVPERAKPPPDVEIEGCALLEPLLRSGRAPERKHLGRADRTLEGVRKCVLHAIWKAQGKGCGPGAVGVCIGGDRTSGYLYAKAQLFRTLDDTNADPGLAALEARADGGEVTRIVRQKLGL